jgi:hypothetical protein
LITHSSKDSGLGLGPNHLRRTSFQFISGRITFEGQDPPLRGPGLPGPSAAVFFWGLVGSAASHPTSTFYCGMGINDVAAEHSKHLSYVEILTDERANELRIRARFDAIHNAIITRTPKTIGNLWVFLHECGHSKLHNNFCTEDLKRIPPYHVMEVEAEFYAYKAMRKAGLTVPDEIILASVSHAMAEAMADACAGIPVSQLILAYLKLTKTERLLPILKQAKEVPRTTEFLSSWYDNVGHPILKEMPQTGIVTHEAHLALGGYYQGFQHFQEALFV